MVRIDLEKVTHVYEPGTKKETTAVKNVNWTCEDKTISALLGPSGSGKTTLLGIISGLLKPTKGKVKFNGKDVTDISPEDRNLAFIFQFPFVYNMSVYDNLAFPLKNRGLPGEKIEKRVLETAKIIGLENTLQFPADKLDAVPQKLVAFGRGIVREDTTCFLFDEPLSGLNPIARRSLRGALKSIQEKLDATMIYVTHDQNEALTFAEKVAVIENGEIIQYDTPEKLYSDPQSPFVGYFIGSPGMNVLDCSLSNNKLDFGPFSLSISKETNATLEEHGTEFRLGIRPEAIQISTERKKNAIPFKCSILENIGNYKILTLTTNGIEIKCRVSPTLRVSEGNKVYVFFPREEVKIYKKSGKKLVP